MIKLNGEIVKQENFPDGSLRCKIPEVTDIFGDISIPIIGVITWHYESDAELFTLICLRKSLCQARLILPYVPHARMDRVKAPDEVFTLKFFCETINSLNFSEVVILDPHSNVAPALLDRVKILTSEPYVERVINTIENKENLVLFTPDEGAMKRYSEYKVFKEYPSTFGMKNRDWKSGKILNYEILHPEVVKDKDVLIIDDICSYGGTFYHAAKALKAAGARSVSLFVTHMEKSVFMGDMYKENIMKRLYTTNSIFDTNEDIYDIVKVFEIKI